MFDKGLFGDMFDFNGDGKLDSFERAADFAAFVNLTSGNDEQEKEQSTGTSYSVDELEVMDDDERAEILLDAGLDADDYDF